MRAGAFIRICVVTSIAALLLDGCIIHSDMFKAKFSRSEKLTAPLTDITTLDVTTNIGAIRMEAAQVPEVRIAAEIRVKGRTEEQAQEWAEQVRIVTEPSGGTLRIKAIKPTGLRDDNLSVDFTITAPADLALECTTNVGDVRTTDFTKRVKASTNVGAVVCTGLRGDIDLHTNVGDLRADYIPEAPAAVNATMAADVGDVEFTGPKEISAHVTAGTNVGDISTDRPVTVTGSVKRSLHGTLGKGEGQIDLHTNVGSIRIR